MKVIVLLGLLTSMVHGSDLDFLDPSVDPCDDFYQFVCGNFKNVQPRPPSDQLLDLFTTTEKELVEIGKEILSSPKRRNDPIALKKAKAAYKSCVQVTELDDLHHYQHPEAKIIAEYGMPLVDNSKPGKLSWTQIGEIAGKFGIHQMFQFIVKNFSPEEYILIMFPDNFDKPKLIRPQHIKTYDEVLEESFRNIAKVSTRQGVDPLDTFIVKIAKHLESTKEEKELIEELQKVKDFSRLLFSGGIIDDNMTELGDVVTLGQLQEWTQNQFGDSIDMNWIDYFDAHFKPSGLNITKDFVIYLMESKSVYGILNLVKQTDPSTVKNFVLLRTFLYMAPDSDQVMRAAFEEYYKSLGLKYYQRPEYCTRKILDVVDSASLSFAVAHDYVNYHFNRNKIRNAVTVIQNLKEAFKMSLIDDEWIDTESRDSIGQKIDNLVVFLGYPDFIDDKSTLDTFYENVRICESDNYGNAQRIRAFKKAYAFTELINHNFWGDSPFEVNAYAMYTKQRIMVPLSMLHSTYYRGDDPIFDYGRFGSIVAHEFIHHFDTSGIHYNQDGTMAKWLSDSVLDTFHAKNQCLEDQYWKYYVPGAEKYVNGTRTINENIADNGGIRKAFVAMKKFIKDTDYEVKNSTYTAEQLFFMYFGSTWCSQESDDYLVNLVTNNQHPPSRFRVLGILANMEEFSEAFNCPVGSYMNPEEKCRVW